MASAWKVKTTAVLTISNDRIQPVHYPVCKRCTCVISEVLLFHPNPRHSRQIPSSASPHTIDSSGSDLLKTQSAKNISEVSRDASKDLVDSWPENEMCCTYIFDRSGTASQQAPDFYLQTYLTSIVFYALRFCRSFDSSGS